MADLSMYTPTTQQLGDIPSGAPRQINPGYSPVLGIGPYNLDTTAGGNAARGVATSGLQMAQNLYTGLLENYTRGQMTYPGYTPTQSKAPTQAAMYNYTPTAPIQQIQAPNYQYSAEGNNQAGAQYNPSQVGINMSQVPNAPQYQGLMGGDYDALQQALAQPGQLEAQRAYELGQKQLESKMGAQGLYGSTMMGNSMSDLSRAYQETLAKNAATAATTRYGMQQQDLTNQNNLAAQLYGTQMQTGLGLSSQGLQQSAQQAQAGLGLLNANLGREANVNQQALNAAQMQMGQAQNVWNAGAQETAAQNAYNQQAQNQQQSYLDAVRNWQNQGIAEQGQYNLAANQYQQQLQEQMMNQALALAGQGAPLSQAGSQYLTSQQSIAAQQQAAAAANQTATTKNYLTAAGGLLGGATGMLAAPNAFSNMGNNLGTLSNYFSSTPSSTYISTLGSNPYANTTPDYAF